MNHHRPKEWLELMQPRGRTSGGYSRHPPPQPFRILRNVLNYHLPTPWLEPVAPTHTQAPPFKPNDDHRSLPWIAPLLLVHHFTHAYIATPRKETHCSVAEALSLFNYATMALNVFQSAAPAGHAACWAKIRLWS